MVYKVIIRKGYTDVEFTFDDRHEAMDFAETAMLASSKRDVGITISLADEEDAQAE